MYKDERDLLDVLKAELAFLGKGGYGCSPRESWRQPLIFEDSPSCMNYDCKDHTEPCSSCVLFQLVPAQFRGKLRPCSHIPLNVEGDTLDLLGRSCDQFEIEEVFGNWLRRTIAMVEKEQDASHAGGNPSSAASGNTGTGNPLSQKLHPKCANPACARAFRWLAGGKFFRFRPQFANSHVEGNRAPAPLGIPRVEHYWLCDFCSRVFILAFEQDQGVVLKALCPVLLAAEHPKQPTSGWRLAGLSGDEKFNPGRFPIGDNS
jgi:hypothetical protein